MTLIIQWHYPPHMCTLFCPHPLLFPTPPPSRRLSHSFILSLFLFPFPFVSKRLSQFQSSPALSISSLFFFFFHLISKRSPLPLLDLYEANCSQTWTENWEASRPELNTVGSVFLRLHLLLPLLLPLLLLSMKNSQFSLSLSRRECLYKL